MKHWTWLVLFVFGGYFSHSQDVAQNNYPGGIKGTIIDSSSSQGIAYATVTLFQQGNPKPVSGASANDKGFFRLDNLATGNYRIEIGFIGYKTKVFDKIVISTKHPVVNLERIFL